MGYKYSRASILGAAFETRVHDLRTAEELSIRLETTVYSIYPQA